ncbi:hypothetical protein ACFW9F_30380 [Streptomyces sp. NPDC059506]|uniref:hypothetical protein n=1 Tax=Streptomyces TaxID=1883 RepID=UPI000CB25053|nr:hypothetical protein [Streptomyces sp. SCUT-3]PLW72128.1 hypothetical protein C0036_14235 [Streptomyces sp. DJ]QMV24202.1 hypothetical protein GQS52_23210 [Streptomyces sp. SCUT-3]
MGGRTTAAAARSTGRPGLLPGPRPGGTRHPLVAVAMAMPLAVLLTVAFGGWDAVVVQASSVAGLLGR